MADRIYGIQQSQPQDVASYFKQVRSSRDASQQLVQNIFLVSKIGPSARATDGYDLIFGDRVAFYDTPLSDGRTLRYGKIDLFVVGHGTVGAFDLNAALDLLASSGYSHVDQISTGNTKAGLLALTDEADGGHGVGHAEIVEHRLLGDTTVPSYEWTKGDERTANRDVRANAASRVRK